MNYLKYDPSTINTDYLKRDFIYTFLDQFTDYCDISLIYHYLLSIDQFKLKNIWNHFVKKWRDMNLTMNQNNKYKQSIYSSTKKLNYIHTTMKDEDLDHYFSNFIDQNICRLIFVLNCILTNI